MQSYYNSFKVTIIIVILSLTRGHSQHALQTEDFQAPDLIEFYTEVDRRENLLSFTVPANFSFNDNRLCQILISQAELRASNHNNGWRPAQLIVLDNEVARNLVCPEVFERPIQFMTIEQIRRAKITAYIEFESVVMHSESKASAVYRFMCSAGCESRKFDLELRIYEGTNDWSISRNITTTIENESKNIK